MRDRNRFPVIAGFQPHRMSGSRSTCSMSAAGERLPFSLRFLSVRHSSPRDRPCQLIVERASAQSGAPGTPDVVLFAFKLWQFVQRGAGAVIVGTTNDAGNMRAARVAPQGCFKLMAIETAGMLQDRGDLVPCRQSFDRTGRSGRLAESAPREQRRSQSSGGGQVEEQGTGLARG